jgi:hypothetical protein
MQAQTRYKVSIGASFIIIVMAIVAGNMAWVPVTASWLIGLGGLMLGILGRINYWHSAELAQNNIKRQLVAPVLRSLGHTVEYDPKRSLSPSTFRSFGWLGGYEDYVGQDLLKGKHGATSFVSSMVYTVNRQGQSESAPNLLLIADSNKHFRRRTVVVSKLWRGRVGEWASAKVQQLNYQGLQAVHLEDITFKQLFDVYAQDQVEARYLLTPDVMQRLVALQRSINRDFRVAFDRGRVYVQVDEVTGFDLSLDHKIHPNYVTRNIRYRWELIGRVIDALGLNDRVWTKP